MAESAQPRDVITMGRTGIDLYPLRPDVPLTRPETFEKDRVALARRELTLLDEAEAETEAETETGRLLASG
uniref:hypothetical protein n=1 Tax=Streptomyces asoensis TaxID=249586 RepID=UPI003F599937